MLFAFLHSPPHLPKNGTLKTCGWFYFFYFFGFFFMWIYGCWLFLSIFSITKRCQWFWINSLLAVGVLLRWDLWLPDPRTECSLRGRGPGQVHWRGSHPGKRQDGLWAAEGAHVHHPGVRLWRGSWWRQHEEVSQVSQQMLRKKNPKKNMFCKSVLNLSTVIVGNSWIWTLWHSSDRQHSL